MKLVIALVYLFYCSLTTTGSNWHAPQPMHHAYVSYPHTNNRQRTHGLQQPQRGSLPVNIFDALKQQQPTLPSLQQHGGLVYNSYPLKALLPTVVPITKHYKQKTFWLPLAHKKSPQVYPKKTSAILSPLRPQQRQQRPPQVPRSRQQKPAPKQQGDYRKVLTELGLDPAFFVHPIKPDNQITHNPYQSNQITPADDYEAYKRAKLSKNYRDDKTHEPYTNFDKERDDSLEEIEIERSREEQGPISDHEYPNEIPTRPIYPGEGRWAKPGVKYRPFISKQKYTSLEDDSGEIPDGYDIFQQAEKIFKQQENDFHEKIKDANPYERENNGREDDYYEHSKEEKNTQNIFIPIRNYAQVRKTDEVLYLPKDRNEPRLREVINDSKIQTIYTEEGYEDSAYDHAGHEKNAETGEADYHSGKKVKTKYPKKYYKETYIPPPRDDDEESEGSANVKTVTSPKGADSKSQPNSKMVKSKEINAASVMKPIEVPKNKTGTQNMLPSVSSTPSARKKRDLESQTSEMHKLYHLPLEIRTLDNTENVRIKRYTNDFPNLEVDTDSYLDTPVLHRQPKHRQKIRALPYRIKYPYYNSPDLPENSPLRYAENLNYIPRKEEGDNLAFYNQADRRLECEEVGGDIDPVPDRVKNAEHESNPPGEPGELAEQPEGQRLTGLGDKIDCFKIKYFGVDPLDSPLFKEKYIAPPKPIFQELLNGNQIADSEEDVSASEVYTKVLKQNEIKESNEPAPIEKSYDVSDEIDFVRIRKRTTTTTTTPVPSLITTPSYTVKLVPKHIYDQIHLLNYLPSGSNESTDAVTTEMSVTETVTIEDVTPVTTTETTTENFRQPKSEIISDDPETIPQDSPELLIIAINDRADTDLSEEVEATTAAVEETPSTEAVPTAQPLRKVRRRKRPRPQTNQFGIFDINDFLPPPLPSQYTFVEHASTNRKQKPVSEVQYKEEIKPSEQLNVFEDVINNIRNTPTETTQNAEASQVQINTPVIKRIKKVKLSNPRKVRIKNPVIDPQTAGSENLENVDDGVVVDDPAIIYPQFGQRKPTRSVESSYVTNQNISSGQSHKVYKPVGQHVVTFSQTSKTPVSEEPAQVKTTPIPNTINNEEHATEVLGLVPPDNWLYQTIYTSNNPEKHNNETVLNTYPVVGMKPPPASQKILTYADFKAKAPIRRIHHHIAKRHALRSRYTEIKRNNNRNKTTTEEEVDDYVPRRPTNFHYDVAQAKIVYDRRPNYQSSSEITTTRTTSTSTTTNIPTTTKKPEMNWFEYIKILKSNNKYIEIPEEKATEKQELSTTTVPVIPASGGTTSTPEYLNFIAKLKQNNNYKVIEEPKDSKKKTTTTTVQPPNQEAEAEAEESIDYKHVQNSPGGQLFQMQQVENNDDSDTENKVKNYTPKTVVDTSKYKTIERSRVTTSTEEVTAANRRMDSTNPIEESDAQLSTPETSSQEPTTSSTTTTEPTTRPRRVLNSKLSGSIRSSSSFNATTKPRRPTNLYTRTTTLKPSTTTIVIPETTKTFFRRRFNRTRLQATTEKFQQELESESKNNKTLKRRHQPEVPVNHKPVFTPLIKPTQSTPSVMDGANQVNVQVTPRTVTAEILYQTENLTSNLQKHEIKPRKIADVEVMKNYDKKQQHGGNYKKEEDFTEQNKREGDEIKNVSSKDEQTKADDVEIIKDFDRTRKHGGNYKPDEEAQETVAISLTNRANDVLKIQRKNFRRKMSTTSTTTTTTESALPISDTPKEEVEIVGDYDEDKKTGGNYKSEEDALESEDDIDDSSEETVAVRISDVPFPNKIRRNFKRKATVADAANTQELVKPKQEVDIIAPNYDATKKRGGNLKPANETDLPTRAAEAAKPKVSNIPILKNINRNLRRKIVTSSTTAKTPKLEIEVIAPIDENKKHGGNYKPAEEQSESRLSEKTALPKLVETSEAGKVRRHFRRKASVTSDVSNKNTVTSKPKEEVEVMKDYDKAEKHGGNYKPEDEIAETATEIVTTEPEEDVEIVGSIDPTKKHGGNYKPDKDESDDAIVAEETVLPTSENNKIKRHFRRRVSVSGEASDKNKVVHKPKEDVEIVRDYDKSKRHGGNLKAESSESEENKETTVPPKLEVETVAPFDEEKKHGGNYKPADEGFVDGEIPIEAAETALPKIAEIPQENKIKKHTRRRVSVGSENSNKVVVIENPKEDVEIIKDYDETQRHGGNYKAENENVDDLSTTTTKRSIVSTGDASRRHSRRKTTTKSPAAQLRSTSTTPPTVTTTSAGASATNTASENVSQEIATDGTNEPVVPTQATIKTTPETKVKHVRSQRMPNRRRNNIVASQMIGNRLNDVEIIKDYDKAKQHGGNYRGTETTTTRGRTRQNNKIEDVEVFSKYNRSQKTGGNYRRQRPTTEKTVVTATTATTSKPPVETTVVPTAFELDNLSEIEQLTDAVPKPFSFYSDSKLPDKVNHLEDNSSSSEDEDEASTEDYFVGEESRVPSTTKKPLFIKDPKKRKYIYAPVK